MNVNEGRPKDLTQVFGHAPQKREPCRDRSCQIMQRCRARFAKRKKNLNNGACPASPRSTRVKEKPLIEPFAAWHGQKSPLVLDLFLQGHQVSTDWTTKKASGEGARAEIVGGKALTGEDNWGGDYACWLKKFHPGPCLASSPSKVPLPTFAGESRSTGKASCTPERATLPRARFGQDYRPGVLHIPLLRAAQINEAGFHHGLPEVKVRQEQKREEGRTRMDSSHHGELSKPGKALNEAMPHPKGHWPHALGSSAPNVGDGRGLEGKVSKNRPRSKNKNQNDVGEKKIEKGLEHARLPPRPLVWFCGWFGVRHLGFGWSLSALPKAGPKSKTNTRSDFKQWHFCSSARPKHSKAEKRGFKRLRKCWRTKIPKSYSIAQNRPEHFPSSTRKKQQEKVTKSF